MMTEEEKQELAKEMLETIIPAVREAVKIEIEKQMVNINANFAGDMSVTHKQPEPNEFTKMSNYVHLLLQAQGVGHKLHDEIDEGVQKLKLLTFGLGA